MNESIDREEAEKRLKEYKSSNTAATMWIDIIFPPFEPKEGEVIAVWISSQWKYREFISMDSDGWFLCYTDDRGAKATWSKARPLTDTEKGL